MHILFILALVFGITGLVGNWLDGFTSYQGVKKFGPSIEGDKGWLTQLMANHPYLYLFVEPLGLAIINAAFLWVGPKTDGGGYFLMIVIGAVAGCMGYWDAYNNYQVNSKQ